MSKALDQRLHWSWPILLVGLAVAAAFGFPSTMATAMSRDDPIGAPSRDFCVAKGQGRVLNADPTSYQKLVPTLESGDTLLLAPGRYTRLTIAGLNGEPGRCIIVSGPAAGPRALIAGQGGHNTVEIVDSSYIVLANLTIDSLGMGGDGIRLRARRVLPHITLSWMETR